MTRSQNQLQVVNRSAQFFILLSAVILLGTYVLLRYAGLRGETDTNVFTSVIRAMQDSGELIPSASFYPNGYGFQTLSVFLIHATGMSLSSLQLIGGVLLMVWIVFPAWLIYYEFTETSSGAVLATVLLFVQPEFLFPILRGSHEKFTRGLMFLCVYLLIRSLHARSHIERFTSWILAYYIASYALITFNNLLATSFIMAVSISMILTWVVIRVSRQASPTLQHTIRRLTFATVISLALAFLFTFYIYPPARHDLLVLEDVGQQMGALLLDVETESVNPYGVIDTGWTSRTVYFILSLANWLLLGMSAIIWLWQSLLWLIRRQHPPGENENQLLLWAFYGAFAFIGALSVVSDISGSIGNLQHRLFPSFAMFGAPVVAKWLTDWTGQSNTRRIAPIIWAGIGILAILSTFKATNEPLFSNKWIFYIPAEMQAIDWASEKLAEQALWVEYDERLTSAVGIRNEGLRLPVRLDSYSHEPWTRNFLVSDVIRSRSVRLSVPLPIQADSLRSYDNGQAQIYHLRPRTPYQQ